MEWYGLKIDELLKEELVFLDIDASDKMEVIDFLADEMAHHEGVIDVQRFKVDLVQRPAQFCQLPLRDRQTQLSLALR